MSCINSLSLPSDIMSLFATSGEKGTLPRVTSFSSAIPTELRVIAEEEADFLKSSNTSSLIKEMEEQFSLLQERLLSLSSTNWIKENESSYGFFKKREFSLGSKIAIHADFHGNVTALQDFYQFVENQSKLYAREVTPIISGDLMDRGEDSFLTLSEALQNPLAEIIRGNHESLPLNQSMLNATEKKFFHSIHNSRLY